MSIFVGLTAAGGEKFPTIIAEIHHFLPPHYCRAIIMATLVTSHLVASSSIVNEEAAKSGHSPLFSFSFTVGF
jgi:hypothetical protein